MMQWIARLAIAAPKRILLAALLITVGAAIFGGPVAKSLSAGGFTDPDSESVKAAKLLSDEFGTSDLQLLISVTSDDGARGAAATAVAAEIAPVLERSPVVAGTSSFWTAPPDAAKALVSKDGRTGLVIVGLKGGDNEFAKNARDVYDQMPDDRDGVTVRAGGVMTFAEANERAETDLVRMESIAIPLSFIALAWVFGGLFAAALPLAIGIFAIVGSLAVLRAVTLFTDVSLFAMNLTAAMGLALAIDYTLLIVSRYRDEIAEGSSPDQAVVRTMATAGRTVAFSALTVALSMSAMALFPMYFLRSFAYAGVAVVLLAALAAIVITPAAIVLLGKRLDSLDVRAFVRRLRRQPENREARPVQESFWYRNTHFVMRHAVVVTIAVGALLLLLGTPFLGVKWGFPDDRVLPASASSREVGDRLRTDFANDPVTNVSVVIPDTSGVTPELLGDYASRLSKVADVSAVSTPAGRYVAGSLAGPPSAPAGASGDSAFLTVQSTAPLFTDASNAQLRSLGAVPGPADQTVLLSGAAQYNVDSVESITKELPVVLAVIGVITFILLFLVTGSVVLPLKALVLNILSLTATFGALVWIFQEGHLGGLGTTATGTLVANVPILMFCVAFGLSMDYEVFVLSRIREYWVSSDRTSADNDECVALGIAHTGRVVTAAALLMSISFAALITADVSFMKMFGVGLTIAVLVDAVVVRTLLLPALMHLLGQANWWAPAPLARLHHRLSHRRLEPQVATA